MTVNGAEIGIAEEKSLVAVRQESGKMSDSQRVGVFFGLFDLRGVEMEPDVAVLLRLSVKEHCL